MKMLQFGVSTRINCRPKISSISVSVHSNYRGSVKSRWTQLHSVKRAQFSMDMEKNKSNVNWKNKEERIKKIQCLRNKITKKKKQQKNCVEIIYELRQNMLQKRPWLHDGRQFLQTLFINQSKEVWWWAWDAKCKINDTLESH